jgi:hypothetical protein
VFLVLVALLVLREVERPVRWIDERQIAFGEASGVLHFRGGGGQVIFSQPFSRRVRVVRGPGFHDGLPNRLAKAFVVGIPVLADDGGDSRRIVECEALTACRTILKDVHRVGFDLKGGQQSNRGIGEVVEDISELSRNCGLTVTWEVRRDEAGSMG